VLVLVVAASSCGMGAVHGVHLKYVAMSAACAMGAWYTSLVRRNESRGTETESSYFPQLLPLMLWYSAAVHLLISVLFMTRSGTWIIGKSQSSGQARVTRFDEATSPTHSQSPHYEKCRPSPYATP